MSSLLSVVVWAALVVLTVVEAQIGDNPIIDAPCGAELTASSLCIASNPTCALRCAGSGIIPQQQQEDEDDEGANGDVTQCSIALQNFCSIQACCPSCSEETQTAIDCSLQESCGDGNTNCDSVELPPPPTDGGSGDVPDEVSETCLSEYYTLTGCLSANALQCLASCTDEIGGGETNFENVDCNDETSMLEFCGSAVCCTECAASSRSYYDCEAQERSCVYKCSLVGDDNNGGNVDGVNNGNTSGASVSASGGQFMVLLMGLATAVVGAAGQW